MFLSIYCFEKVNQSKINSPLKARDSRMQFAPYFTKMLYSDTLQQRRVNVFLHNSTQWYVAQIAGFCIVLQLF